MALFKPHDTTLPRFLEIFISVSRGVLAGQRPQLRRPLVPSAGERLWRLATEVVWNSFVDVEIDVFVFLGEMDAG